MYVEFKNGEKYAGLDADTTDTLATLDKFKDAGYVLTDDDLIIDIDCLEKDTVRVMITMFNIKTQTVETDRGYHLYYKKPEGFTKGANRVCALGFPIELKHKKNTKAITIKRDGVLRNIENEGVRETAPEIFMKYKQFGDLLGYADSEGRNNALFKHRSQLEAMMDWEKVLRFVNNYIFAEPLDEKEFLTISRDMTLEVKDNGEPEVAEFLMNEYRMVIYSGSPWYWYKGEYVNDNDILKRLIFKRVGQQKTRFIDEIIKQIDYRAKIIDKDQVFDIKLNNGILRKGKFIPIESEDFTPYSIDVNYFEDAEPVSYVDDYISKLTGGDPDYRLMLMEVLGHTLITDKEFKRLIAKFFIFRGDGSNGKGTLLQIIKRILNPKNCTGLSINNMEDERYLVTMKGKLANLGDDIEPEAINNKQMKMLKNISTCDFVAGRELYKQSDGIQFTISLIFTSNSDVKSFEKGEAYKRRVFWLPMFTKIEEKDKDPLFITKLTSKEALEYWVKLIVDGYFRLYKNRKFTRSDVVDLYNVKYHENNNKARVFIEDVGFDALIGLTYKEIVTMCATWCEENGEEKPPSKKLIKETLWEIHLAGFAKQKTTGERLLTLQSETKQDIKP